MRDPDAPDPAGAPADNRWEPIKEESIAEDEEGDEEEGHFSKLST